MNQSPPPPKKKGAEKMQLREYQKDIITKIRNSWRNGFKSPCLVAPCGSGKSVILAEIARLATQNKKTVYFVAHRKELCEQITSTFESHGVDFHFCKIFMIQALKNRLEKIENPDLLLVDENHHANSNSYQHIFEKFDCHRIGVTATPIRLDGSGLIKSNDTLIETVSANWLIDNSFLSPATIFSIDLVNMKNVKMSKGDYDIEECEQLLSTKAIFGDVIKHYRQMAIDKKTIVYCVSVAHSQNMSAEFNNAGISSAHIDGTTPKIERQAIIDNFRSGNIQVLTNCDIISEGFDVPDCDCVILLRPTQSLSLYIQQAMRCMRFMPAKKAIILDHVGNIHRFGFPWTPRKWTLEGKKKKTKEKIKEDNSFYTCEKCFFTWAKEDGRICTNCGEDKTGEIRKIEIQDAINLIEMTEEMFSKGRKSKRAELKEICSKNGYKKGWVWYQMQVFDEKHKNKINKMREELQ